RGRACREPIGRGWRFSRHGRRRHDRRTCGDRQCDLRCAFSARHRHLDAAGHAGADIQVTQRKAKMTTLAGRVALVTGGGRDVGADICRTLAAAGATVAVNYNSSKDEAEAVAADIVKAGGRAVASKADVSDLAQVKAMIA